MYDCRFRVGVSVCHVAIVAFLIASRWLDACFSAVFFFLSLIFLVSFCFSLCKAYYEDADGRWGRRELGTHPPGVGQ